MLCIMPLMFRGYYVATGLLANPEGVEVTSGWQACDFFLEKG